MGLIGISKGREYARIFGTVFLTASFVTALFLWWLDQKSPTKMNSFQDFWIFTGIPSGLAILMIVVQAVYNRATGVNRATFHDMIPILLFTWPLQFKLLSQLKLVQK